MRNSTKYAALLVLALSATTLAACGPEGGAPSEDDPVIALLLPDTSQPRYELHDRPNFEAAVEELCADCTVMYSNANGDSQTQQQQAENAITNGAKVIAINPIDVDAASSIARKAQDAGVKIVTLGRLIQNAPVDYSVSMDSHQLGLEQAEALVSQLKANGTPQGPIVMINGAAADNVAAAMKAGAHEVFDREGVEIALEYDTPEWAPDVAQTEMDQAITSLGSDGFVGVYAMNDGMAGGAIAAMKGAGIDPKTRPVTGLDADIAALQRIITGEQFMTEYIDIKDQADKGAEIAVALAKDEKPKASLLTAETDNGFAEIPTYQSRIAAVTIENMKAELIDSGFVKRDEICTAAFEDACTEAGL